MEIKYLDKNKTYTAQTVIRPQYIVLHSTGAGLINRMTLFNAWNNRNAKVSCHGMVDAQGGMITLPLDVKGWHVGGKGNGISIGFELCEPMFIAYADKWHTKIDTSKYNPSDSRVRADFEKRWKNAVEMAAYMCRETGIDPKNVLCHAEMHAIGRATNHADVFHWFNLFGDRYSMDAFRNQVRQQLRMPTTAKSSAANLVHRTVRRQIDLIN